ncbi:MAG: CPBP family intramembrane glutamic endopeptidase [Bacteroidota bacterium]
MRYFQCLFGQDETATLAILAPSVIFGLVHLYQGWHAVVKITAMAVMFGFVFVHTQSLWLLMAVHALVDLIGGALGWWLVGEDKRN